MPFAATGRKYHLRAEGQNDGESAFSSAELKVLLRIPGAYSQGSVTAVETYAHNTIRVAIFIDPAAQLKC